jgi:hypothetical protein
VRTHLCIRLAVESHEKCFRPALVVHKTGDELAARMCELERDVYLLDLLVASRMADVQSILESLVLPCVGNPLPDVGWCGLPIDKTARHHDKLCIQRNHL